MGRKAKPKKGDIVDFTFAGSPLNGIIQEVQEIKLKYGIGNRIRYMISDGKYIYPVGPDSIIEIL